jgi:hypothetical protein
VGASGDYLDTNVSTIDNYADGNVGTDLYINETSGVILGSLNTTTGLSTTNGEIKIIGAATAFGDLTAKLLTAGGTDKNIYLTTANGGSGTNSIGLGLVTAAGDDVILDSDWNITDSDLDLTSDVVADGLYLDALGSVGGSTAAARVETTVNTIDDRTATDNVSGDIYMGNTIAVILGSINGLTTDSGLIDITATGITTDIITASGGHSINLYATAGNLVDLPGGLFTATETSTLRASGIIGTLTNPYDVNVTGDLWVWTASQENQVSAYIMGPVTSPSAATERAEIELPSPPGLVILNNHLMGGGNYGSGSPNGSILSFGYGYNPIIMKTDMFDLFYDRAFMLWGYKLMLPWALSQTAAIDYAFLLDVPATVDATQLGVLRGANNLQPNYYIIHSLK